MRQTFAFILPVVAAVALAACSASPSAVDYDKAAADALKNSFQARGIATLDRLEQDQANAACAAADISGQPVEDGVVDVSGIVEKPDPDVAPSTLAVAGRYILTPGIFHELENIPRGVGGEIQLTDGIEALMQYETVLSYRYKGRRFDCGSKLGYLQASVEIGLQHPETGAEFAQWLANRATV